MQNSVPEIPVVYFHSVAPSKNPQWFRNYLTLELHYFEGFLKFLRKNKYETIFFNEYFYLKHKGEKLKKQICVLTFDDGYVDNYIYVWPLLKKYGFKGTIFINPESVDHKLKLSLTLEDVWKREVKLKDIEQWGYLSWEEMVEMQGSGVIDIQSHNLTHSKYFVSEKLTGFHHPGNDCLYVAGNLFRERQIYYINDPEFEKLIPYGFPVFEEKSSAVAKKVEINPDFISECVELLKDYDFSNYNFSQVYNKTKLVYSDYHKKGLLVLSIESQEDYMQRVKNEITKSKKIIEDKLKKEVSFLCWPHGDNNEYSHKTAMEAGFLMTTTGKAKTVGSGDLTRIGERMGIRFNNLRQRAKTKMKLKAFSGAFPYRQLLNLSRKVIKKLQ